MVRSNKAVLGVVARASGSIGWSGWGISTCCEEIATQLVVDVDGLSERECAAYQVTQHSQGGGELLRGLDAP
jgi:hypothetical protein